MIVKCVPRPLIQFVDYIVNRDTPLSVRVECISIAIYVVTLFLGLVATVLGLTGPQTTLLAFSNRLFFGTLCLLIGLFLLGRITYKTFFTILLHCTLLFTSVEMIYAAIYHSVYYMMLLVGDMFILAVNHLFALLTYRRNTSFVLGGSGIGIYILCMLLTHDSSLYNFFITYLLMFVALMLMGHFMYVSKTQLVERVASLEEEKEADMALLHLFRLERQNIKAFAMLAKKHHNVMEADKLLDMLDNDSQFCLLNNIRAVLQAKAVKNVQMEIAFPELTRSEREIARLIIMGKTLKEICLELDKSESNITVQRSNMRRKLHLQQSDSLKDNLRERLNGVIGTPPMVINCNHVYRLSTILSAA